MNLQERLHSHLIQIVRDRNPYLYSNFILTNREGAKNTKEEQRR